MKLSSFLERLSSYQGPDGRGDYLGICPAHADGSPSLLVGQGEDGRLLIHCRAGCAKSEVLDAMDLSLRDLFSEDDRPDTNVPVSKATQGSSGELSTTDIAALRMYVETCSKNLQAAEGRWAETARAYVGDRFGISLIEAEALKLGFDPGGVWYDGPLEFGVTYIQVPRLVIPFHSFDGVIRGLQGRALTDHKVRWSGPTNPEGASWSKYAFLPHETGLDSIVVTEGPGDALTAVSAGFDALAIRGAATAKNEALLAELVEGLRGRRIVLAGDDDDAGRSYNSTLRAAFEEAGLSVYELPWRTAPQGASDVTAWREEDPDGFVAAFQAAVDGAEATQAPTVTPPPLGARYTEAEMARRLARRLADEETGKPGVLYTEGLGFFVWEGNVWTNDREGLRVHREAQQMVEDLIAEGERNDTGVQGNPWAAQARGAKRFEASLAMKGLMTELQAMVLRDHEDFDSDLHLLTVANGTIDLRTGDLLPHDRDHLITRALPLSYDPEARAPRWERFLDEIFPGHPEVPDYLRRLVGYGITGETVEQCMAVLWGKGANGKSIFTDTLTETFRQISTTTPFSTFEKKPSGGIPNDLAALKGSRLVMASEGEAGSDMAESVIKRVTGSDLIAARFMRKEFFEFRPSFLIMLATNHKPKFRGQDEGLWRRVKLIPFARYFAPHERDHALQKKLWREKEGILTWAVQGAVEWYAADDLGEPESVREATEDYRKDSDGLMGFVDIYVRDDPEGRVPGIELFERWKDFILREGVKESSVWDPKTFYAEMTNRGYDRRRARAGGRQGVVFFGIRLLTEEEAAAEFDEHGGATGGVSTS